MSVIRKEWCPYCDSRQTTFERESNTSLPGRYPDKTVVCTGCKNELRVIQGGVKRGMVKIDLDNANKNRYGGQNEKTIPRPRD